MLAIVDMHALDQLLLERFGGKVDRGLALVVSRGRECPDVRNFFLHRSSPYAARGRLNIMGLNTGAQSEQNAERKGGENPFSENNPMQGTENRTVTVADIPFW
jgi:hypothetical protein